MEVCEFCHEEFDPEELIEFGGRQMCADCLDSQTITCDRCGARIWRNGNAGDSDTYLCDSCFENYYTNCSHCGALIREEDAHYEDEDTPLCYDCYRHRMNRYTIQPYGFKPDPVFYGQGERYFGIELEIDGGGESDKHAKILMEIANADEEHIYML